MDKEEVIDILEKSGGYTLFSYTSSSESASTTDSKEIDEVIRQLEKKGKVACFRIKSVQEDAYIRWVYIRNHPLSKPVTFLFKIPIKYSTDLNKIDVSDIKIKIDILSTFFEKWVSRREINEEETRKMLKCYTYDFCVISAPGFLESEMLHDFKEIGIIPKKLTPTIREKTCEICGHTFKIKTNEKILNCPNCNRKIRVKD